MILEKWEKDSLTQKLMNFGGIVFRELTESSNNRHSSQVERGKNTRSFCKMKWRLLFESEVSRGNYRRYVEVGDLFILRDKLLNRQSIPGLKIFLSFPVNIFIHGKTEIRTFRKYLMRFNLSIALSRLKKLSEIVFLSRNIFWRLPNDSWTQTKLVFPIKNSLEEVHRKQIETGLTFGLVLKQPSSFMWHKKKSKEKEQALICLKQMTRMKANIGDKVTVFSNPHATGFPLLLWQCCLFHSQKVLFSWWKIIKYFFLGESERI